METRASGRQLDGDLLDRVGRLRLRARELAGGILSGLHRSAYKGFSQEFVQHRHYTPGDDLRYLDWKLFARSDRLVIRQYQQERNLRVILAVDASASMAYASGRAPFDKFEAACSLAAAVGYVATRQQDAVGLALLGDGVEQLIEPAARTGHWVALTQVLATHAPTGRGDLGENLRRLAERLRHPALIVLVSDLFGPTDAILHRLAWLSRHGRELIVLHVMDPAEIDLGVGEPGRFEDLESDAALDTDPAAVRRAYREQVERFRGLVSHACAALRADYQFFDTSQPLHPGLLHLLARRSARTW